MRMALIHERMDQIFDVLKVFCKFSSVVFWTCLKSFREITGSILAIFQSTELVLDVLQCTFKEIRDLRHCGCHLRFKPTRLG